ncbi:tyrosine-type recombinase/integrase [Streptomyces lydicus]|uniref:tyrosine-type recombinase/integrase n=1 Tax=Streptomyces lydicus TaxID=47763 RepID=UPI0036E07089
MTPGGIRRLLRRALTSLGLTGSDGAPLVWTPHDFRRMFVTDAVANGLPPHIAQIICGHRDISTTATRRSTPTRPSRHTGPSSPAGELSAPARSTARRPARNGTISSATSNDANCRWAPAAAPSGRPASTSTLACGARCSVPTRPSDRGWKRSGTTSSTASRKPNAKGGWAKSRACASASPAHRTSSPSWMPRTRGGMPSISACQRSARSPWVPATPPEHDRLRESHEVRVSGGGAGQAAPPTCVPASGLDEGLEAFAVGHVLVAGRESAEGCSRVGLTSDGGTSRRSFPDGLKIVSQQLWDALANWASGGAFGSVSFGSPR